MPIILAVWEAEITVQGQPEQTVHETHLPFGLVRPKWTGGMAQAVQRLLFKCEALSSNPSSAPPPKYSWFMESSTFFKFSFFYGYTFK
jgi:hypothetical protein